MIRFLAFLLALFAACSSFAASDPNPGCDTSGLGYSGLTNAPNSTTFADAHAQLCPDGRYACEDRYDTTSTPGTCKILIQPYFNGNPTNIFLWKAVSFAPCTQGTKQDQLVTVGWARATARSDGAAWSTNDGRNFYAPVKGLPNPNSVPVPDTVCDGQCTWVADGAPSDFWVKADPGATGLNAVYRQQSYIRTGAQCAAKTQQTDPAATPPACDGFMGTINGVTRCIAKEPPSGVMGTATPTGPKSTTTAAGAAPTEAAGKQYGPNGEQPAKPGDTPSMQDLGGTGQTSYGGPAPSSSTGTTTSTTKTNADGSTTTTGTTTFDIQTCGLPGKPACKIDESGTPTSLDLSSQNAGLGAAMQAQTDALNSIGGKRAPGWSFTFALPTGCTAFTVPFDPWLTSIDICRWQPMIHDIMALLWIAGTIWACIAMVGRTVHGD